MPGVGGVEFTFANEISKIFSKNYSNSVDKSKDMVYDEDTKEKRRT